MALDYGSVKDMYDTLYKSGVTTKPLPEWSQEMNDLTGSDLYSAGLHDNWIKRTSHGIDKLIEATGLPGYTEQFGRQVGGLVGAPEAGAEIGHGLPRSVLNFAPLLIPGGGVVGAAAKVGLTGALTGAEAYEKGGSPLSSLISGATAAALPGVAGKVSTTTGQLIGKLIGSRLVEGPLSDIEGKVVGKASQYIPETIGQKIAQRSGGALAGQAAAAGLVGVSQPAEELARGEAPSSPFTVENLLGLTLGQTPFALAHLGGRALGRSKALSADELQKVVDLSSARISLRQAKQEQDAQTSLEKIPELLSEPPSPEITRQTQLQLSQLRGQQVAVKSDPNLTDDQKVDQLNKLMQQEHDLARKSEIKASNTVFGNSILPETPRQDVIGKEIRRNKAGTWRAVLVSNDPSNPEELRGKVVGYSTKEEPAPVYGFQSQETGQARFSLPDAQWRGVKTLDEWNLRYRKGDNGQPLLPTQEEPMTQEELSSYLHDLDNVDNSVSMADTTGDLQKSVVDLHAVQEQNNLTPTNDTKLKTTTKQLVDNGESPDDAPKLAVKVEVKRTARKIQAPQRELERAVPQLTPEEAAHVSALMGGQGFEVKTADKLSHGTSEDNLDVKPVSDIVTDAAMPTYKSQVAQDAFSKWPGNVDTTYAKDFQDFIDLVEKYGSLSKVPLDEAGRYLAERTGAVPWDKAEVQEFLNRPHVQEWGRELDNQLLQRQVSNEAPQVSAPPIPAGDKFVYSLGDYDPTTNTLNQKHVLPKNGKVVVQAFRAMAGIGKPLQQAEVDFYKQIVPEAFQGAMVDVPKLYEGLRTKGPQVET